MLLLALLLVVLAVTTALGGLVYGTINVVSMGFASILLGLAEDFGIVIYQESRSHPELTPAMLHRTVAPGIFWSALTTAGAFATLNLSSLPGLGQLGSFVALGILTAAGVMLYIYLPWVFRVRRLAPDNSALPPEPLPPTPSPMQRSISSSLLLGVSVFLITAAGAFLWRNSIRFDRSPNPLKPKHSKANAALEQIRSRFGRAQDPLWVLVPGRDEAAVAERLAQTGAILSTAVTQGLIAGMTLPTTLWPQPAHQQTNRLILEDLLRRRESLRTTALEAGFTSDALAATETMFNFWQRAAPSTHALWPSNETSRWMFNKIAAPTREGWMALGLIHLTTNHAATKQFLQTGPVELGRAGVILSGWELLGSSVFDRVARELPRVVLPIIGLVLISLWLAYRNLREVFLSVLTLAASGLGLAVAMNLLHWDWNILNLMALPLLLGMGVDYSIHMQLALRRYGGDVPAARRSVGRALLLAGATTIVGFASLGFSANAGMASLGQVCALGIALALLISVYLLPVWWKACTPTHLQNVP